MINWKDEFLFASRQQGFHVIGSTTGRGQSTIFRGSANPMSTPWSGPGAG
jgi:hypothetical protein